MQCVISPNDISSVQLSDYEDFILLDIENNQANIVELFLKNPKALFVISAGRIQKSAIFYISELASKLGVHVAVDTFRGIEADKADDRIVEISKLIEGQANNISGFHINTRDKVLFSRIEDIFKAKNVLKSINLNPAYDLCLSDLLKVRSAKSRITKRYLKKHSSWKRRNSMR